MGKNLWKSPKFEEGGPSRARTFSTMDEGHGMWIAPSAVIEIKSTRKVHLTGRSEAMKEKMMTSLTRVTPSRP